MRIKINATKLEAEVLDRNDRRVVYVKYEDYDADLDVVALVEELKHYVKDAEEFKLML